ncbi:MAG: GAF domain-containing sensor histidine kinase [Anaerolinea sp.]|nr:GAF domain-containing sensor histidine kinase [Anaerolinea sp.]
MTQIQASQVSSSTLARLVEISRELNSKTDIDDLLTHIIQQAAALTGAEAASILLLDPHTRQLHFKAASDEMDPAMADAVVPLDSSIAGTVLTSNQPLIIADVAQDPRWNPSVSQAINFQTRSILGVPMHDVDRPVGVLEALNKHEGGFTPEDVETLAILADIAGVAVEKARLIQELQHAYDELNELDQRKTDFIAIASHELRTPLSVILGYVSFLRDEADPAMAEQLDNVMAAAVKLRSLIQDMLNLQYVDAGQATLSLEPINLGTLLREIVLANKDTIIARQQQVTLRLPSRHLVTMGDRQVMGIVLNNLLDNAIKFTPGRGRIRLTLEVNGAEAWLHVQDTGVGIPQDKLERIFKRFYQVEHHLRRQHEGLGLGLAIARELVELQNGRIWAESIEGQGSVFHVALPLQGYEAN